ncbi:hypothetical protein P8610_03345 [Fictibacillus sp. UD]
MLFRPNILTFFSSSQSERLLLNKEFRIIHRIVLCLICFFQFPLALSYHFLNGEFYKFFEKHLTIIILIILIGFFASWFFNYRFKYYAENKKNKEYMFLYIFLNIIYFPTLFFTYGFMIFSLEFSIKQPEFWENILPLSFLYIFFLSFFYLSWTKLLYQEIKTEINLSDGKKISNCYFLHPTYGKNILLGDHPKQDLCKEIIVVPIDKIEFIQFKITNKIKGGIASKTKEKTTRYVTKKSFFS